MHVGQTPERGQPAWSGRYVDEIPQPALLLRAGTGEVLHANSVARARYGLGAHQGSVPNEIHALPGDLVESLDASRLLTLVAGHTISYRCSISTPSGRTDAVVTAAAVVGEDGAPALLVILNADQPEHAGQTGVEVGEAVLRAIALANFVVCYDWDLASGSCTFSGHFDELLGLGREEHPTSIEGWLERVHPEDVDRVVKKNRESIDSLQPYLDEYRMVHKDGRTVVVSDSGQLIAHQGGVAARMAGGIRDVTQEHEMQRALEERNVALRVILDQRGQDRLELERTFHENVNRLLLPALDRLQHSLGRYPQVAQVNALRQTVEEMVKPFSSRIAVAATGDKALTRREKEILSLVSMGRTTQEMADLLVVSPATISFHRGNIRRKLNIPKGGQGLATRLTLLDQTEYACLEPDDIRLGGKSPDALGPEKG